MSKLIFIVGELNVEIRSQELSNQEGYYRLIHNTQISIGCRAVQQANYCKKMGMNVFLLGRIGDDLYGKMIHESLVKSGISTNYIEKVKGEHTGLSIEVISGDNKRVYFDPGANLGVGDFTTPVEYYLHLCDAVIVNKWCNHELRNQILQVSQLHLIPNVYVHSGFPGEDFNTIHVDFLFVDLSDEQESQLEILSLQNYVVKKGIFIFKKGEILAYTPSGDHVYSLNIPPEFDGNYIVTLLATTMNSRTKIAETASFKNSLS